MYTPPTSRAMYRHLRASHASSTPASAPTPAPDSSSSVTHRLARLEAELSSLRRRVRTVPAPNPFRHAFLAASDSPRAAARTLIRLTRRRPPPVLLEVAKLCLHAPVGRVGHRKALRALAALLCDEVLRRQPDAADAMCVKGEAMLPYLHYGRNDPCVPRAVLQEAFDLFDAAAQRGSTLGMFLKGRWLLSMDPMRNHSQQAALGSNCVKSAAQANNPRALVFLAHRYEYPELDRTVSFASDLPKGKAQREQFILDFYRRAAERGDADALNDMGTSYAEGYGGLRCDFDQAVRYYVQAIDRGSLHAYDNLGTHYETGMAGKFVDRIDHGKALYYYRQGARQRCPKSAYNLAAAYEEGMGEALDRDTKRAEVYYRYALKLADDDNDALTAAKILKDLVALYITRVKLSTPTSAEVVKAMKRLVRYTGDAAVVKRSFVLVEKAIAAALRGRTGQLDRLLGDLNCKLLVNHVRALELKVKAGTASEEETAMHRHALGWKAADVEDGRPVRGAGASGKKAASRPRKRRRT